MKISDRTRLTELNAVVEAILRLFDSIIALKKDAILSPIILRVRTDSGKLTISIKSDKIVSTLDDLDRVRDAAVKDLGTLCDGYAVIPIAEKKAAGLICKAIFDKYGRGIAEENFASESTLIKSLLQDFEAENAKNAVSELLGMSEMLSILAEAQSAFDKASDEYMLSVKSKGESATVIKKRLLQTINGELVPFLKAVKNVELYADFARGVEAEIEKVNALSASRSKKTEVKK